jgi:hypothetical protein
MKCFGMFHFTRVYVMLILALLLDPLAFLLPRVAITLDTCYRSGIFQAFTLQSIKKNRLSLWLLPIILFQTWDYTRRISCIYCTNHCVSDLGLYKEDLMYLLHQSFCFRLGIIQGGSHIFIAPIIAMMSLEKWKCPTTLESKLYV